MTVISYDPRSGAVVASVEETTAEALNATLARAKAAAPKLVATSPATRQRWLHAVAEALEFHRDELAKFADLETALGLPRLAGEVDRAAGQLRFYGDVAAEGSYIDVAAEEAGASPFSMVRVNRPLGPVAVFGASNFPFAFSVLGNDTAAALAAGCPVIVKAHPAHVGLTMRQAEIAHEALAAAGAPPGTFGVVNGHQVGIDLVKAPEITAVGFTGSQTAGLALWRIANQRDVPIPVYAEMGTVNPAVVTRTAAQDITSVAKGFVGSFTLGNGQFCTKPGLLLAPAGSNAVTEVAAALREAAPSPVMLTAAIAGGVAAGIKRLVDAGATLAVELQGGDQNCAAPAAVLTAAPSAFEPGSPLLEEVFGAVVLVCEYADDQELADVLNRLQPALVASVFTGADDEQAAALVELLAGKVGRVAVDDWPTGVAFNWAQQHGGPWPATSAPAATSVGAAGLARFVRPVSFQSAEDSVLPPEARSDNPWGLPRRINGRRP